ncbi:unnamed protein product, partial [Laminaria digitata]
MLDTLLFQGALFGIVLLALICQMVAAVWYTALPPLIAFTPLLICTKPRSTLNFLLFQGAPFGIVLVALICQMVAAVWYTTLPTLKTISPRHTTTAMHDNDYPPPLPLPCLQ